MGSAMIISILYVAGCVGALAGLYWFVSKVEERCPLPDDPWQDVDVDAFESQIEKELANH